MDSDRWIARLAAAKMHYALQHHHRTYQSDRQGFDDFEAAAAAADDEVRPDLPSPYFSEDHDVASLCSHLGDEHLSEPRAAVCPICSVKVSQDMLSHITLQHGHLFKMQRRRRLRRVGIPNSQTLSLLGRDIREAHIQALLASGGYRSSNNNASNAATDLLISSLVSNFSTFEAEETSKSLISAVEDGTRKKTTSLPTWKSSMDSSLSYEERERKRRLATVRANFVHDLLVSTLFDD